MSGFLDRLKAVRRDPGQAEAYNKAARRPMNMNQNAAQAQLYGGLQTGDAGQLFNQVIGTGSALDREKQFAQDFGAFRAGLDAPGSEEERAKYYSMGDDGQEVFNTEAAQAALLAKQQQDGIDKYASMTGLQQVGVSAKGAVGDWLGRLAGDFASGVGSAFDRAGQAVMQAGTAGAFADARNAHARNAIVAGAQSEAENMNLAARAQAAGMADSAIAQANAYGAGMQGIAMNGIEGSANMERNLQYGQDRADAEEQLAFDLQGKQAADLGASMVNSFDQLSQGKQQAMSGAFGSALGSMQNQLTRSRMDISNAAFQMQAGPNDWDAALSEAEAVPAAPQYREETAAAAEPGSPESWQVPGAAQAQQPPLAEQPSPAQAAPIQQAAAPVQQSAPEQAAAAQAAQPAWDRNGWAKTDLQTALGMGCTEQEWKAGKGWIRRKDQKAAYGTAADKTWR